MLAAVIFDFGDTLAAESSEVKDRRQVTQQAELFPGVIETLEFLQRAQCPIGLLADSVPGTGRESYDNVLGAHGASDYFSALITSDQVGVNKPDQRMFLTILEHLSISTNDYRHVLFVGNRLERDISGANRLGLLTAWARMTDRYRQEITSREEVADYSFTSYQQLLSLLEELLEK